MFYLVASRRHVLDSVHLKMIPVISEVSVSSCEGALNKAAAAASMAQSGSFSYDSSSVTVQKCCSELWCCCCCCFHCIATKPRCETTSQTPQCEQKPGAKQRTAACTESRKHEVILWFFPSVHLRHESRVWSQRGGEDWCARLRRRALWRVTQAESTQRFLFRVSQLCNTPSKHTHWPTVSPRNWSHTHCRSVSKHTLMKLWLTLIWEFAFENNWC